MTITCKNCGYESHCGTNLRKRLLKETWDEQGPYSVEHDVEVCKQCRCDLCKK